jgi:hypothetical protein
MYKIVASPPAPLQLERGVKCEIPHILNVKRGIKDGRKSVCLARLLRVFMSLLRVEKTLQDFR